MNIRLRASASSDVGRHRRTNEDSFGFDMDRSLFVVCDGVGGAQAGELASRSAVDCVLSFFPAEICEGNAVAPALHVEGLNPHGNLRTAPGQPLLDREPGVQFHPCSHKCGDVHRLYLGKIEDATSCAERRDLLYGVHVGAAGVPVADMRAEDLQSSAAGHFDHIGGAVQNLHAPVKTLPSNGSLVEVF